MIFLTTIRSSFTRNNVKSAADGRDAAGGSVKTAASLFPPPFFPLLYFLPFFYRTIHHRPFLLQLARLDF